MATRWLIVMLFVAACGGGSVRPVPAAPLAVKTAHPPAVQASEAAEDEGVEAGVYGEGDEEVSGDPWDAHSEAELNAREADAAQAKAFALHQRSCAADPAAAACIDVAYGYLVGRGTPRDDAKALAVYEQACTAKQSDGCYGAAWMIHKGRGGKQDPKRARSRFVTMCANKVGRACIMLGEIAKAKPAEAATWYEKACAAGEGDGCNRLGIMLEQGAKTKADRAKAAERYREGCTKGSGIACSNLGYQYEVGEGVVKDEEQAFTFYERACRLDETACFNYANTLERDRGDLARSHETYRRACAAEVADACEQAGRQLHAGIGTGVDFAAAARYQKRGCDLGSVGACVALGFYYDNGHGVPPDHTAALRLFQTACDADSPLGCHNLAWDYENGEGVARDVQRALATYQKACDLKYGDACTNLGIYYRDGKEGVATDEAKAAVLFGKGCSEEMPIGCRNLAYLYLEGRGVRPDAREAIRLLRMACKGDDAEACTELAKALDAP